MEVMETQSCVPQFAKRNPKNGLQKSQTRGKYQKRKPLQHPDDIVYSRGISIQTMPSLSKQLRGITACVIGLQYVWEYRSPSKSVPPHYHCKLCNVARLQHEMLDHIKGWKHSFRYMKKAHPYKVSFEEEDVLKDPMLKKTLKDIAAEVQKTEGRGQLKVILKEPCDAPAFNGLRSATPRPVPPPPPMGKGIHFGAKTPGGGYRMDGFEGYPTLQGPPDYNTDQGHFHNNFGHNQERGDEYGDFDGYEPSRQSSDYPSEHRDSHIDRPMVRQMNTSPLKQWSAPSNGPDSGDLSNTLLSYLDTFQIENENDAQLVLKVTQKLTDILMEYRLRNISGGPDVSTVFSSSPSIMPRSNTQFSGYPGSSRYTDPVHYYE